MKYAATKLTINDASANELRSTDFAILLFVHLRFGVGGFNCKTGAVDTGVDRFRAAVLAFLLLPLPIFAIRYLPESIRRSRPDFLRCKLERKAFSFLVPRLCLGTSVPAAHLTLTFRLLPFPSSRAFPLHPQTSSHPGARPETFGHRASSVLGGRAERQFHCRLRCG